MKFLFLFVVLTSAAAAFSQDEFVTIRAIDFYGHDGLNVNVIRAALPLREGDRFSRDAKEKTVSEVREAIKRATGREVSRVFVVMTAAGW
jgi:outer membrane protein assembly factor BamA